MISAVSQSPYTSHGQQIREVLPRLAMNAEIAGIRHLLDQHQNLQDPMSQDIRSWFENFSTFLRTNEDVESVKTQYIQLLQQLLVDPIAQAPLDEEAVLGSDLNTYGNRSLRVYLSSVPESIRHRCPLDINNETPFTTTPHPIVRYMTVWLRGHHALLHSAQVDAAYDNLRDQNNLPRLPTPQSERYRQLLEVQTRRDRQVSADVQAFAQQEAARHAQNAQNTRDRFAQMDARAQENDRNHHQQINEIARTQQTNIQNINQAIDQLERDSQNLTIQVQDQREHLGRTDIRITRLEREDANLHIAIKETERAIKKRNKGWAEALCITVACVGAGCLLSWAATSLLASTGSASAIVIPTKTGVQGAILIPL